MSPPAVTGPIQKVQDGASRRLVHDPSYIARVGRAVARLDRVGATRRRVAAEIGRSERCVYEVLTLAQPGRPTLALIEGWLDATEASRGRGRQ